MKENKDKLIDETCWVYIQLDEHGDYIIAITYDEAFHEKANATKKPILLWRKFEDAFTAAGYRIVLKSLPLPALKKEIERRSPK